MSYQNIIVNKAINNNKSNQILGLSKNFRYPWLDNQLYRLTLLVKYVGFWLLFVKSVIISPGKWSNTAYGGPNTPIVSASL